MQIGIDPTVDFAFKKLLGSPEHSAITIHFLNAVLARTPRITQVDFINPFLEKEFEDDKVSVLDLLAIDEHGRRFNVEMQTTRPVGMQQRLVYYAASLYVDQLGEGESYVHLRPVITICVLGVPLFMGAPEPHLEFLLRDRRGLVLTEDLQVHTVELPKYQPSADNREKITDPLEQWIYFLRFAAGSTSKDLKGRLADHEFAQATGVLEMISRTAEQRRLYQSRLKRLRDAEAQLDYAREEALNAGREEGRQQGREVGLEEGREVGLEEGREAGLEEGRAAGLREGRETGVQEGREEGVLVGQILVYHRWLQAPSPSREELLKLGESDLQAMLASLEEQLENRDKN